MTNERLSHLDTLQTLYSSRFQFHFFSFYANRTTSQFETFWNRHSIWVVSLFFRPLPAQKRKRPTRLWQAGHKAVHLFRLSLLWHGLPNTNNERQMRENAQKTHAHIKFERTRVFITTFIL